MSGIDLHLLTGAYVADALEPAERAEFEAHLAGCEDCAIEVAELRETAARLAVLSTEAPPDTLRADVLAAISSTRQASPDSDAPVLDPAASPRTGGSPARHWAARFALPAAAALLGVLALSLGAWGLNESRRADRLGARADLVASVLSAPDATTTGARIGDGSANLVTSAERDRAVLVATGLPAPDEGSVYELWRIDADGRATPAGTYAPDGSGVTAVAVDGSLDGIETVAVTVEPEGGSTQPTTDPVAAFTLA